MINRELIRLKVVQLVYAYYQNEGKTLDVAEKELTFSLEKAYELYLYLLTLLVELKRSGERRDSARLAREKRTGRPSDCVSPDQRMAENQLLAQLAENETVIGFQERRKEQWPEEEAVLRKLYAQCVESEPFRQYLERGDFSYAADREIVRKLYKTLVCDSDIFDSLLEDHSLYWNDDKDVVDTFVLKTIKRFKEDTPADFPLLPAYDAEEDRDFAHKLFRTAIERGTELRELIRANSKNWEFNRLAFMDVVIMQIALAEILTFDSIPLNVSFNEYINIADAYSTPHSASYINGMLDGIVRQLQKEGRTEKLPVERAKRAKAAKESAEKEHTETGNDGKETITPNNLNEE